jgi:DNA-binding transcriptional regulator YiaG
MKTINMKNFGGLTYITIVNIPVKESEFGDVIDMKPRELESLAAQAIIEHNIPIRGAEFRIIKSAIDLSNEAIGELIGVSRNTVLKWGKNTEDQIPLSSEMLLRLLTAEKLGIKIDLRIEKLKESSSKSNIKIKAT